MIVKQRLALPLFFFFFFFLLLLKNFFSEGEGRIKIWTTSNSAWCEYLGDDRTGTYTSRFLGSWYQSFQCSLARFVLISFYLVSYFWMMHGNELEAHISTWWNNKLFFSLSLARSLAPCGTQSFLSPLSIFGGENGSHQTLRPNPQTEDLRYKKQRSLDLDINKK